MNISGVLDTASMQQSGLLPTPLRGAITYVAGTTGAIGQHTLFTITGMVEFNLTIICTTPLTSGGVATFSIGNAGAVTRLYAVTTATDMAAGDFFFPGAAAAQEAATFSIQDFKGFGYSSGTDITADILTATITGGVMQFILRYTPLSAGASVTLGAEMVAV